MRMIRLLASDFIGLCRVCGLVVALRWLMQVALNLKACMRDRNLQPADLALGNGPFAARLGYARAKVAGLSIVTGIREVWVRDCYLADGFLSINDGAVVVDLGANIGTFSMLALGSGPHVKVVSVEPNAVAGESLLATARVNGWEDRLQVCRGFVGGKTETQDSLLAMSEYQGAQFLTEAEFVARFGLTKIDFLKCDIEGSEFDLLRKESLLLGMAKQVAIELHTAYGRAEDVILLLRELGFEVIQGHVTATDCILNARRNL